MYRSVIVPLDHSAADEYVLPIAVQVARGLDAILRLLYIPKPEAARTLEGGTSLDVALPSPARVRRATWNRFAIGSRRDRI